MELSEVGKFANGTKFEFFEAPKTRLIIKNHLRMTMRSVIRNLLWRTLELVGYNSHADRIQKSSKGAQ